MASRARANVRINSPSAVEKSFNSPSCPRCYEDVVHDGDTFGCEPCCVTWDERGIEAEFTDDYGTIDSDS